MPTRSPSAPTSAAWRTRPSPAARAWSPPRWSCMRSTARPLLFPCGCAGGETLQVGFRKRREGLPEHHAHRAGRVRLRRADRDLTRAGPRPETSRPMFRGTYTAIVTPFRQGAIDETALRQLIEWQIESGVDGIVPVGTTGESPTLDHAEHTRVIEIAVQAARGRCQVIAGTGSNSTAEAIALTEEAEKAGADRRPPRHALLQQAFPGGPFPALPRHRGAHEAADHSLQHPRPLRHRDRASRPPCAWRANARISSPSRKPAAAWSA